MREGSGTEPHIALVERAYQLAHGGEFANANEIGQQLKSEGYSVQNIEGHLEGATIRAALSGICAKARGVANRSRR